MIVEFPSLAALELALGAGAIPASALIKPVSASSALEGPIAVRPSARLSPTTLKSLARWGAAPIEGDRECDFSALHWAQLLPLTREPQPAPGSRTSGAVLFVLEDAAALGGIVGEILRLGNDRQSYRVLSRTDTSEFALLRVVDPPYYTLLRALERNEGGGGIVAYVERSPGVWIEHGYRHPLEGQLRPAKGEWLLLRPERQWTALPAGPLHDVYEAIEFALPPASADLVETPLAQQFAVPLRLAATTGHAEPAALWVLRDGFDAVNELVHHADDSLLSRLSFAVAVPVAGAPRTPSASEATIVLRARPSREAPPALELGVGFYSYLKLPNLFLPCEARLHPPLRRDLVGELLAGDTNRLTWLYPGEAGAFEIEGLPDDAFRPLGEWVEYVFDRDAQALEAWRASCQFDFASFVVDEPREGPTRLEHEPVPQRAVSMAASEPQTIVNPRPAPSGNSSGARRPAMKKTPVAVAAAPRAEPTPSDQARLAARLRDIERQFRESPSPPDSPERSLLWREMAALNAQLGRRHEATLAWSNAVWLDVDEATADEDKQTWLTGELSASSIVALGAAELERLATLSEPTAAEAGLLAAWMIAASAAPARLVSLSARFLERHEQRLPVRVSWLAWRAVARLTGGDVLAMARARDRLLAQLFHFGLRPSHDLAAFIRSLSGVDSERVRAVRGFLPELQSHVERWLGAAPTAAGRTADYAALLFGCALARLGDALASQAIVENVRRTDLAREPANTRPAHEWLRDAFAHRIAQARAGEPSGELPPVLIERLNAMKGGAERQSAYAIERMREFVSLLEPAGRSSATQLAFAGAALPAVDRSPERLLTMLDDPSLSTEARARTLVEGLQSAPRFGEAIAAKIGARATDFLATKVPTLAHQASVLGNGLLAAAHFGDGHRVAALVAELETRLGAFVAAYLDDPRRQADPANENAAHEAVAAIEALFAYSLRGMRKLGQSEAILRIVRAMEKAAATAATPTGNSNRAIGQEARDLALARLLTLRTHIAAACFTFGERDRGAAILGEVRQVPAAGDITPLAKTNALCRYAEAWGHAPCDMATSALGELFEVVGVGASQRRVMPPMEERHRRIRSEDAFFSLLDLRVIDAALHALVGDEFLVSAETRRWLDEDEFLIRRRIHDDVRQALEQER